MPGQNRQAVRLRAGSRVIALGLALSCATCIARAQVPDPLATQPSSGVNLVVNGEFEKLDPRTFLPEGWTTKHPENVRVVNSGDERNRIVEMTGDEGLMATYGVDLFSPPIHFKPNTRYRCTGYAKTAGPSMMIFVKGYATVTRKDKGKVSTFDDEVYQMRREVAARKDEWTRFSLEFDVKPSNVFSDFQHEVKYVKVQIWAYYPKGTCWWDEVRFEEVGPIPGADRRHDKAMTHMGVKPTLGPSATQPDEPFDAAQGLLDAAAALSEQEFGEAAELAEKLLKADANKPEHRVVAARALVKTGKLEAAKAHAGWLLDGANKTEPWQQEWARLVNAEVDLRSGDAAATQKAREALEAISANAASPHVRQAAGQLIAK